VRISRLERIVCLSIGTALALLFACGSNDDASSFRDQSDASFASSSGSSGLPFGDGGTTGPAKGVVLVHAAGFRSFRVCFEGYRSILPQPDRKVMPESNTVGVDVGAAIRIPPLTEAPGTVYVIPNKTAHTPDDPEDLPCGAFLDTHQVNEEYLLAGKIDRPVGVDGAEAIVLTGCGTLPQITNLNIAAGDCPGYADGGGAYGTLNAVVMPLATTNTATLSTLPVELYNASQLLVAQMPPGAALDVSYGDLDAGAGAPLAQKLASSADLYHGNQSATLDVDQTNIVTFGTHGFRIAYRTDGGADDGGLFATEQSLAQVQEASQPLSTPTAYFTGATNFALILLGDPRMVPKYTDGGPNPTYDGRRAVHLLAVPVRAEEDAGVLGNAPPTAAGASDASRD
jgi:hypothetical protein